MTPKEAQNVRWAIVGSGIAVGITMLVLWYEVKTEIEPVKME